MKSRAFGVALASLCLSLAACSQRVPHDAAAFPASLQGSTHSVPPIASLRDGDQATRQDAVAFVVSRLGRQDVNQGKWSAYDVQLTGGTWRWKERYNDKFNINQITETYSVDPSALSPLVTVNGASLTFECKQTKCISVMVDDTNTEDAELRVKNTWHFSDPQEASRVAKALTTALQLCGATQPRF